MWSCENADDGDTEEDITDKVHDALGDVDPPYEPGEKSTLGTGWELLAATKYGECDEQANLMVNVLDMLGVSSTSDLVYASSNSGSGNCLDLEDVIDEGEGLYTWLIMDFDAGTGYNWNAFEGCAVVDSKYYAVWPKHKADDDYDMLKNELAPQQYWVETVGNITPGDPGWQVNGAPLAAESLP